MLFANKVDIPRLSEQTIPLSRQRVDKLNALTLIHAPAGYGKTTFAVELLNRQPGEHLWFSIDALDNDPVRFWTHFIGAFRPHFAQESAEALSLLSSADKFQIDEVLDSFIRALMCTSCNVTLVLDDFHHISNKAITQALNHFLDYMPSSIRLILTSRTRVELRLEARLMRGQAAEFDADYLAFNPEDIRRFWRQNNAAELNAEQLALIEEKTEGWVSAIKLMFFSSSGRTHKLNACKSGVSVSLYHYLLEEVLGQLEHELVDFIHTAALFDRFCADMLDQVRQMKNSFAMLTELLNKNLFIHRVAQDSEWYRFHDLFRASLLQSSPGSFALLSQLRRTGAKWLEQHGQVLEAIDCFSRNSDWPDVVRLLEVNGRQWLREGQSETLNHYFGIIPDHEWRKNPALICMKIWLMRDSDKHRKGEELLTVALETLQTMPENHELLCEIYTLRAIIDRLNANWPATLAATKLALHHADVGNVDMRWRSYTTLGAYEYTRGQLKEAREHLMSAVKYAAIENHRYGLAHSAGYLAEVLYQLGELQTAIQIAHQVGRELEPTPFSKLTIGVWRFAGLPDLLREQGRFDEAEATMDVLERILKMPEVEVLPKLFLAIRKTYLLFSKRDYTATLAVLDEIDSTELLMRFASPFASASVGGMRARIHLNTGDLDYALDWCNRQTFDPDAFLFRSHQDILTQIAIRIMNAEYGVADQMISECIEPARHHDWKLIETRLLLLKAVNKFESNLLADAKHCLLASFSLLMGAGYRTLYTDDLILVRRLFNWARQQPELAEYVTQLHGLDDEKTAIFEHSLLSKREIQLLQCVVSGLSDKEIGSKLSISTGTVKTHLRNIFRKLGAKNRAHALALYSNLTAH